MKLNTIVNAGPSLQKLILQDVPIKTAYALAMLIDKLNPHLSFYGTEIVKCNGNAERIEELANAIDAGNIKVANQLANHSRT